MAIRSLFFLPSQEGLLHMQFFEFTIQRWQIYKGAQILLRARVGEG